MSFYYKDIGAVDMRLVTELRAFMDLHAVWKEVKGEGTDFYTWHGVKEMLYNTQELNRFWPDHAQWTEAFFLCIPPGGQVHRHADTKKVFNTYHIPVETNPLAVNMMYDPDPMEFQLEVGRIYVVDRDVEHESFNRGETPRTHLLMEVNDGRQY